MLKTAKSKDSAAKKVSQQRSRSRSKSTRKKRERSPSPTAVKPIRIHVGRLTRNITKDHIHEIFSNYGSVKFIEFPIDRFHPKLGRGFAYIEYVNAEDAENAMKHMDGGQIDGQEVTVAPILMPRPRPPRRVSPGRQRFGRQRFGRQRSPFRRSRRSRSPRPRRRHSNSSDSSR